MKTKSFWAGYLIKILYLHFTNVQWGHWVAWQIYLYSVSFLMLLNKSMLCWLTFLENGMWLHHWRHFWLYKVCLEVLKESWSKMCRELLCFSSYMLQQLVLITLNFTRFCSNVLYGIFVRQHAWLICVVYPSALQWLFSGALSFTYAASLIRHFILLVNWHFFVGCALQNTIWNPLCTVTTGLDLWNIPYI